MKRFLTILLLCVITCSVWALHIETVGAACEVHNGQDTLFIFNGQPHLRSLVGNVNWWRTLYTDPIQTDADETTMANSGDRVIVEKDGKVLDVVYVFDYNDYSPTIRSLSAQMDCQKTVLYIDADVPAITYRDTLDRLRTLAHDQAIVTYTNLQWEESKWTDVSQTHSFALHAGIEPILQPIYAATSFSMVWDQQWREQLGIRIDSVKTETYEPIAARGKLTTLTTIRGTEEENEVDRPIDPSMLAASGPVEVSFASNPTPGVRFYQWRIYKSNELIAERKDQDIRYTFYDPGADLYKVVLVVRGDSCSQETDPSNPNYADSVNITVQKSQLFVPNVFTPNGDGQNDEFRVIYTSIKEYYIWVYNRWGKVVYESSDPAKGWDGYIGNRPAAESAYYYIIRATGTDGTPYRLSGDINLLR